MYKKLRAAFAAAHPDKVADGGIPEAFYQSLEDSLGDDWRVEAEDYFVHSVGLGNKEGFLIVRGDAAWFVGFNADPDTTEVVFLGDLRGGRYKEVLVMDGDDGSLVVEALYDHPRLARGETLRARVEKPALRSAAYTSTATEEALERGDRLRRTLRRWSNVHGPEHAAV